MARRTSFGKSKTLNILGRRVRELREKKKWSQADLVRRLQMNGWDIDPATISRIESQSRTLSDVELLLIAKVLDVRLQQFEK